jgi:hypothetical protein
MQVPDTGSDPPSAYHRPRPWLPTAASKLPNIVRVAERQREAVRPRGRSGNTVMENFAFLLTNHLGTGLRHPGYCIWPEFELR